MWWSNWGVQKLLRNPKKDKNEEPKSVKEIKPEDDRNPLGNPKRTLHLSLLSLSPIQRKDQFASLDAI